MEFKKPKKFDPEYRVETYYCDTEPEHWEKYYWDENNNMRRWESSTGMWYEQDEEGNLISHNPTNDWASELLGE